jgi:hypothetical protein
MSRKTKTPATKEEATPALVLKLRFLEFRKGTHTKARSHEEEEGEKR